MELTPIQLDSLTNCLTFTANNTPFVFNFAGEDTPNSCYELLGFYKMEYSYTMSLTAPRSFNLSPLQSLNFVINDISMIADSNHVVDPTFTMPIMVNNNDLQVYYPPTNSPESYTIAPADATSTINIKIVDNNNVIVPIQHEWNMILVKVRN